jgi:guanylate kinase
MSDVLLGKLYVVAAPSGCGKTSLVNALVDSFDALKISISYTTRAPRPNEVDDKHYHFVDQATFQSMVDDKAFLEHAEVFGYQYGTSHPWVMKQLKKGIDIVLEIDWQGARQIRQLFPTAVSIFIVPPSRDILFERLKGRGQDAPEVIAGRMAEAESEMQHLHELDYLVVNDDFDQALEDLHHIIRAERLQCDRQRIVLAPLLADLLKNP